MSIWEEVKDRLDIEQVLSQYLQLTASGANLKAKCPFHGEKSASLMISRPKQIWHCFGCGLGGDIFGFVSEIENISRFEALEKLAKQAGVTVDTFKNNPNKYNSSAQINQVDNAQNENSTEDYYKSGLKILTWASNLYNQILLKEIEKPKSLLKSYLLERGITIEHIQTFQLGFAPEMNLLLDLSKSKTGISQKLLLDTGLLVNKNETDGDLLLKDKFKHRLMIPISNDKGNIVGFTGRFLGTDPNRPKYLNSPQTNWFNKGELLFGLDLARKNIYQKKELILVEGHLDLISSYTRGFQNIVASGGTSITESQIKKIKRLTTNLTLALDNDDAGINASFKVFCMATSIGINVNQLIIPIKYKDLDEFVRDESKEKEDLKTDFYLDYYLTKNYTKLVSIDSKIQKQAILDTLTLVSYLDSISVEQYLKKLSDITKISIQTLKSGLKTDIKKDLVLTEEKQNQFDKSNSHKIMNLKAMLCLYLYLPENDFKDIYNKFVEISWLILLETSQIPDKLNMDLSNILELFKDELQLIWDEELSKKIFIRSNYPKEIIKTIDFILKNNNNTQYFSENLKEKFFEYNQLLQNLNFKIT